MEKKKEKIVSGRDKPRAHTLLGSIQEVKSVKEVKEYEIQEKQEEQLWGKSGRSTTLLHSPRSRNTRSKVERDAVDVQQFHIFPFHRPKHERQIIHGLLETTWKDVNRTTTKL